MPSADRRDKNISVSGEHRLKMVQLLFQEMFPNPKIPIQFSRMELDRPVPTTTFDTYQELKIQYPNKEFYFLIGGDIVGDIETKWDHGQDLVRLVNFLVFNRLGYDYPANLSANFLCLDKKVRGPDISSTFIRDLITKGQSTLPYTAATVAKYIGKLGLYKGAF